AQDFAVNGVHAIASAWEGGLWIERSRRKIFPFWSEVEKYSFSDLQRVSIGKTILFQAYSLGVQKGLDLTPPGGTGNAAKPGAFQRARRRREAHGVERVAAPGEREREGAVEGIAGAQRIDGPHREHRHAPQARALAPQHILGSVGDGEEAARLAR